MSHQPPARRQRRKLGVNMHGTIWSGDRMDFSFTSPSYPSLPGDPVSDSSRSSPYGPGLSPVSPAARSSPRRVDRQSPLPAYPHQQHQHQHPQAQYGQYQQPSVHAFGQRPQSQHTAYNPSPHGFHQPQPAHLPDTASSYTQARSTSDTQSAFANAGSDRMEFIPQSSTSDIDTFPGPHTDLQCVFSKDEGSLDTPDIPFPQEIPPVSAFPGGCSFIRFLEANPGSYPSLYASVQAIVQQAGNPVVLERCNQWRRDNPTTPSLNSTTSTAPSHDTAYLCPNAGSDPPTNHREIGCSFPCPTCYRSFKKKDDLRKHMQARNPPETWQCIAQGCNNIALFGRLDKYRDHLKTKHKQQVVSEDLKKLAKSRQQSYPERCPQPHCHERLQSWGEWFEHHLAYHRVDTRSAPHTPRPPGSPSATFASATTDMGGTPHLPPIERYVSEQERSEGIRVGVSMMGNTFDQRLKTLDQLFPPPAGYPGHYYQ